MKRRSKIVGVFFAVLSVVIASCVDEGEDRPTFEEQLQIDIAAIDDYLAANNISNTEQHESGIRYRILTDSVGGVSPTRDSCVTANYQGILMESGQEFDNGTGISFPLDEVILGWQLAIPLLNEGDSATLYIPSVYAYGYIGYPPEIPANSNLIFNVGIENVGSTFRTTDNISRCE